MIQLERYSEKFESEYWKSVDEKIDYFTQKKIIDSCKKFLPEDFFTCEEDEIFKSLILAPFNKLKEAHEYIKNHSVKKMKLECFYKTKEEKYKFKEIYKTIYDSYKQVANSQTKKVSMRVRIVRNSGLTVCPYCNRDYINCRADNVSGAQLDHFFSKSKFPLFAVCLYNLVPVCGNCNRVKSSNELMFVSPFDNSIDWNKDINFSYTIRALKEIKIIINSNGNLKNNIKEMRIDEAYQIHDKEVLELIEKMKIYNSTQKEEFKEVLSLAKLTDGDIKRGVFGPEITKECMRTKPLGKMMSDLHKKLNIY